MTWVAVFNIPCDCGGFSLAWLLALIYEVDRVTCHSVGLLYTRSRPSLRCKRSLKVEQQKNRWKPKADGLVKTTFRFCLRLRRLRSSYDLVKTRLSESEAEAEGETNHDACSHALWLIGLVLPLLVPAPTIWFSLDHKRHLSDGVLSRIGTLFSLDHKLYAS